MKYIILIGLILMLPIVSALDINQLPEITLTYDTSNFDNTEIGDNNIYDIYCYGSGSICHIYRTDDRHTDLTGD